MKPKHPLPVSMDSLQSVQNGLPEMHEISVPNEEIPDGTHSRFDQQTDEAGIVTTPPFVNPEPSTLSDNSLVVSPPDQDSLEIRASVDDFSKLAIPQDTVVFQRVGVGMRGVAFGIDYFVMSMLGSLFWYGQLLPSSRAIAPDLSEFIRFTLFLYFLSVLPWVVWEAVWGSSLGKKLLGLQIRAEDGTPACPTSLWKRSLWKYNYIFILPTLLWYSMVLRMPINFHAVKMGVWIFGFLQALFYLGCLFALSSSKQAWHDEVTKTAVFRSR